MYLTFTFVTFLFGFTQALPIFKLREWPYRHLNLDSLLLSIHHHKTYFSPVTETAEGMIAQFLLKKNILSSYPCQLIARS